MTFDEFVAKWRAKIAAHGMTIPQEAIDMAESAWDVSAMVEREACAKVCEETDQDYNGDGSPRKLNYQCADAIRARNA